MKILRYVRFGVPDSDTELECDLEGVTCPISLEPRSSLALPLGVEVSATGETIVSAAVGSDAGGFTSCSVFVPAAASLLSGSDCLRFA